MAIPLEGAAMSSETTKPTLYDRLGGVYSIAAVVDDFIDRVCTTQS
jgi:truncated hemoglobin YjbI